MFRLKIDIPLGEDETISAKNARDFMEWLKESFLTYKALNGGDEKTDLVEKLQYIMFNDIDRSVRNYLDKDNNGHASTRKSKISIE